MAKKMWKPGTFIYPLPAVLVSCGDMENSNLITIAWTRDFKYRSCNSIYIS